MKKFFLIFIFLILVFFNFNFLKSDLVIDGGGGSLELSSTFSLGIAAGSKLTLRNITINNLKADSDLGPSASRLIMHGDVSQLVLENTTLSIDDDYTFTQGSLAVRGNSAIVGESGKNFIFQGYNIYIDDSSQLRIGKDITIDCETTGSCKQLFKYGNAVSSLFLDGATLKIDSTDDLDDGNGMVMVGGNLIIDGRSTIDNASTATMAALQLGNGSVSSSDCNLIIKPNAKLTVKNAGINFKGVSDESLDTSGGLGNFNIDPDGSFMVTTTYPIDLQDGQMSLDFNTFTGITDSKFTESFSIQVTSTWNGDQLWDAGWSPDGQYLAFCGQDNPLSGNTTVRIFKFDGSTLIYLPGCNISLSTAYTLGLSWHPSGKYLAFGGANVQVGVYSFDGTSLTQVATMSHGNNIYEVCWTSDGRYLAVGGKSGTDGYNVRVYSFNGSSLTLIDSKEHNSIANTVYCVDWTTDGKYLAIGGDSGTGGYEIRVYSFDGSSLTELSGCNKSHGAIVYIVSWNPNGEYLVIGGASGTGGADVRVYSFDGSSLVELSGCNKDHGNSIMGTSWNFDGRYISVGGGPGTGGFEARVYSFDGTILTLLSGCNTDFGNICRGVPWAPDGKYIAAVGAASSNLDVRIYPAVFADVNAKFPVEDGTLRLGGRRFSGSNLDLNIN